MISIYLLPWVHSCFQSCNPLHLGHWPQGSQHWGENDTGDSKVVCDTGLVFGQITLWDSLVGTFSQLPAQPWVVNERGNGISKTVAQCVIKHSTDQVSCSTTVSPIQWVLNIAGQSLQEAGLVSRMNLVHSLPFHETLSGWVIGSNPDRPSDASDWTQGPVQLSLLSQSESKSVEQVFWLFEPWGEENEVLPALIALSLWRLWIPGSTNLWSSQPCSVFRVRASVYW